MVRGTQALIGQLETQAQPQGQELSLPGLKSGTGKGVGSYSSWPADTEQVK